MKVDVIAMWQGVSDAYDADEIDKQFYELLWSKVKIISYPSAVGRRVCDYEQLMQVFAATPPPHSYQSACLWRRLGSSLASGISVVSQE